MTLRRFDNYYGMGDTNDWLSNVLIYSTGISFVAIFVAVAAISIDTQGAYMMPFIDTCVNFDNTILTGDQTSYNTEVNQCYADLNDGGTRNCYCVGDSSCATFILSFTATRNGVGCNYIADGDYADDLRQAAILSGICFVFSILYFSIGCCTVQWYDAEKQAAKMVRVDTSWATYKKFFQRQQQREQEEECGDGVGGVGVGERKQESEEGYSYGTVSRMKWGRDRGLEEDDDDDDPPIEIEL